jgi:hypothetical protein
MDTDEHADSPDQQPTDAAPGEASPAPGDTERERRLLSRVAAMFRERRRRRRSQRTPDTEDESPDDL